MPQQYRVTYKHPRNTPWGCTMDEDIKFLFDAVEMLAIIEDGCRTNHLSEHFEAIRASLNELIGSLHYDEVVEGGPSPLTWRGKSMKVTFQKRYYCSFL